MIRVTVSYCSNCVLSVCLMLAAGEVIAEPRGILYVQLQYTCTMFVSESAVKLS